jgi:hypothetical protein
VVFHKLQDVPLLTFLVLERNLSKREGTRAALGEKPLTLKQLAKFAGKRAAASFFTPPR